MPEKQEYTEEEKALALSYVIQEFGEGYLTEDPHGIAMIMDFYIEGLRYGRANP